MPFQTAGFDGSEIKRCDYSTHDDPASTRFPLPEADPHSLPVGETVEGRSLCMGPLDDTQTWGRGPGRIHSFRNRDDLRRRMRTARSDGIAIRE